MQILAKVFYIIIFVGRIGGMFALLLLLLQRVFRLTLPVWAGMLGAAFFLLPVITPAVKLISPEATIWVDGYKIACAVWVAGVCAFLGYYLLRWLFSYRAVRRYPLCADERINRVYAACVRELGLANKPQLLFGTLKEPACVAALLRPAIILNKEIVSHLSDRELRIVLSHELTHVARRHHLARCVYDILTILHWFNPAVWLARHEFAYICETDCDTHALQSPGITVKEYSAALLRLMELSQTHAAHAAHAGRMGVMGFAAIKQRFSNILQRPSRVKTIAISALLSIAIAATIAFSLSSSRATFYPFPALMDGEYEIAGE